jgi:hypothetical protein
VYWKLSKDRDHILPEDNNMAINSTGLGVRHT